jgi:hypothetical protein
VFIVTFDDEASRVQQKVAKRQRFSELIIHFFLRTYDPSCSLDLMNLGKQV